MTFGNVECSWLKMILLVASFFVGGFIMIDGSSANVGDNIIHFLQGGAICFVVVCVILAFIPLR